MALIVCEGKSPKPDEEAVWLWVFREDARSRLRRHFSGALRRPEVDWVVERLEPRSSVWRGGIDTRHAPPSRRFRLVWTLAPAPCRIYTRRRLALEVEPSAVTRHLRWRRERLAVPSSWEVEGWIGRDWYYAGISLRGDDGQEREVLRLKNEGLFVQFLLMYDGIDLLLDTAWLDGVVPRVAEVLGVDWRIVDYTVTPPKITGESRSLPGRELRE